VREKWIHLNISDLTITDTMWTNFEEYVNNEENIQSTCIKGRVVRGLMETWQKKGAC
jgi:hypothetical protein